MPTEHRVILLKAPGGFGKTTLLAECCRTLARRGVPTAWLSLDDDDDPPTLAAYLELAFEAAGFSVGRGTAPDRPPDHPLRRLGVLLRAVESQGAPCVLALDELERLRDPESVALINFLVLRGPATLHLAFACRELPAGLNIASPVLEGRAEILTAEELRFDRAEIARYFDLRLSRRELAALAADSHGWPIALGIHRNQGQRGMRGEALVVREVIENWVESRLLEGVDGDEREFLLDLALFERVDASLLDEVFERSDAASRVEGMSWLFGLLEPCSGRGAKVWSLHPLVADLCAKLLRRDDPDRYRALHHRIALALARREETVAAMRHAAEADDQALVGRILVDGGGARLWLRDGLVGLREADRFVLEETVSGMPRVALARCVVLAIAGRLADARRLFAAVTRAHPAAVRMSDGLSDLQIDYSLVCGVIAIFGCVPLSSDMSMGVASDFARLADLAGADSLVRASFEFGASVIHHMKGELAPSLDYCSRAQQRVRGRSRYLSMLVDLQMGQIAMAQGRVQDAAEWYRRGRQVARESFPDDPHHAVFCQVLIRELNLERNRIVEGEPAPGVPPELCESGTPLVSYAAAATVEAELALQTGGVDAALAAIDEMWEYARRTELPALARFLCASYASALADAGRFDEAGCTWRSGALPETAEGCLDLGGQSWREMEALSCARVRMLSAEGALGEARNLLHGLLETASARSLRRTLMRGLSLAVVLEDLAGRRDAQHDHLASFVRLFAETDYAWSLVREREVAAPALRDFLDTNPQPREREPAQTLLAAASRRGTEVIPRLTSREEEVLSRLERQRDKEIAAELGISADGVRYHIRKLFVKLDARDRGGAVRKARHLGILPVAR